MVMFTDAFLRKKNFHKLFYEICCSNKTTKFDEFTGNPKTFVTSLIDKSFGIPVIVFLLSRGQRKCELGEIHFEKNENPFMSRLKPK